MLVLTRKKGERVLIGDDIVVTLIDIRGDGVRIGFDAPRGVPIQRAEVVTAVTEANTEAAATSASAGELLVGLLSRGARSAQVSEPKAQEGSPVAPVGQAPSAAPVPAAVPEAVTPDRAQPAVPVPADLPAAGPRSVPKPGPRRPTP